MKFQPSGILWQDVLVFLTVLIVGGLTIYVLKC